MIFYQCDGDLNPIGLMMAVCEEEEWSPDPAELVCSKQSSSTEETETETMKGGVMG